MDFIVDETTPRVEQPEDITIQLKPHQLAMIHQMTDLESPERKKINSSETFTTSFGALCDKVGSGKSLTILGLISTNKKMEMRERCVRSFGSNVSVFKKVDRYLPINVIVVPHGIINQWEGYIKENTTLKYELIKSNKKVTEFCVNVDKFILEEVGEEEFDFDILLISSTQYNTLGKRINAGYKSCGISRLIVDEVDSIKIPSSQCISAEFTWFITSSNTKIQNPRGQIKYVPITYINWHGEEVQGTRCINTDSMKHTGYFKSQLIDLEQIYFKNLIYLKSNEEFVANSFKLPEIKYKIIKCLGNIYTNVLNGMVSQEIMTMINAGDINSAVQAIGCPTQDEEGLIKLVTRDLEKNLKNKKIEFEAKQQMEYSSAAAKKQALDKLVEDINKLEDKISSIKERVIETNACPICCDDITNRAVLKCCNNAFCLECISMSLNHKQNCPLCRKAVSTKDLIVIKEQLEETLQECEEDDDSKRSKIENLIKYMDKIMKKNKSVVKKTRRKILIFSEFNNSFNDIEDYLKGTDYSFDNLKGTTSSIANKVKKFKNDEIDILLLNSNYFGSGLNLENTTDMFIFHKMTESMEKQVIGRAQRPGRKDPLRVYKLCYDNEV